MSVSINFPIERVVYIANFTKLNGRAQMEVSLVLTEDQKREVLKQLGASVDGETLARWIAEDLDWQVTDVEAQK